MSVGDRLDQLEKKYLALHIRWARRLFVFCVVMFWLNCVLAHFMDASIFVANAMSFGVGALANYMLTLIRTEESNRTK